MLVYVIPIFLAIFGGICVFVCALHTFLSIRRHKQLKKDNVFITKLGKCDDVEVNNNEKE